MFQKYLQEMNGQSLDKKPERQGSSIVLPHQRTGLIKKESVTQTPNNVRNGPVGDVVIHRDIPAPIPNISKNTELLHSKEPSPERNRGLAASRWNDQSYQGTPKSGIGYSSATPKHHNQKQQRGAVETGIVTPSSKIIDQNKYWTPGQEPVSSAGNKVDAPKSGLIPSNKQDDSIWGSDHQPSAAIPEVSAAKADPGADTKISSSSSQVEVPSEDEWKGDIIPDPRGEWPTELSTWDQVKQDMAKQESLDRLSLPIDTFSTEGEDIIPQHATSFIETWIMDTHHVFAHFLTQNIEHHEDCDVDTFSGVLMSPVEYPRTKPEGLMSRNQAQMTAAILMKQFVAETTRKHRKKQKQEKVVTEAPEVEAESAVVECPNPNEVQIPCHLRPAIESDIQAITAIYNREISDGYKVMDTEPIRPDDFHTIYNQCQAAKMPFFVAVEGYHGLVDTPYRRIIGVALVTAVNRGISGSYDTLSRCGGKLLVIVEPEYRRKKVGTALIDLVITNCTGWYLPKGGYEFVNNTHDWMSHEFGNSPRKWWYLQMEVMILSGVNEEETRNGEEFKWIWNFLEAKFNMILKHYDEKCFYEPRQMNWLDKLTFRCICRKLGE